MVDAYPDPLEIRRHAEELIEKTLAQAAAVAEQTAQRRARASGREQHLAQARRDGEQGHEWQVLQQRMDLHRTTLADIMNGLDHSEEARAVRATLAENVVRARDTLIEAAADPESPIAREVVAGIAAALAENR